MFKMGSFYITKQGHLVKIFNTFKFADGYTINAAIHLIGNGWFAARYAPDGKCNVDADKYNILNFEPFTKYPNYMRFLVWFDQATKKWIGQATDPSGKNVVYLTDIDDRERAMSLIQLGAEQKVLAWMREAGYDEETKELVDA